MLTALLYSTPDLLVLLFVNLSIQIAKNKIEKNAACLRPIIRSRILSSLSMDLVVSDFNLLANEFNFELGVLKYIRIYKLERENFLTHDAYSIQALHL
jgi:hypothetical protein